MDNELIVALLGASEDADLVELGFECKGQLCDREGMEDVYERLWVWTNGEFDVVVTDDGNGYCQTCLAFPAKAE